MLKFPRRNELGICFKRKKGKDFKSSVLKKELVYVFFFFIWVDKIASRKRIPLDTIKRTK